MSDKHNYAEEGWLLAGDNFIDLLTRMGSMDLPTEGTAMLNNHVGFTAGVALMMHSTITIMLKSDHIPEEYKNVILDFLQDIVDGDADPGKLREWVINLK
jgi:hypothetical protein